MTEISILLSNQYLLSKEQTLCCKNSKSFSWSILHCAVGSVFVILCTLLQTDKVNIISNSLTKYNKPKRHKKLGNIKEFPEITKSPVWLCKDGLAERTYPWFTAWFSSALFGPLAALDLFVCLFWRRHLWVHLHSPSSLLGEQLRVNTGQDTTVWYGNPSE